MAVTILSWAFCSVSAQAATSTVCATGCNFTSIQDAIEHASGGDIVQIQSGQYDESITVNRSLTLQGVDTGGGDPVIDAGGALFGVNIQSPSVRLSHLAIQGAHHSAVQIGNDNAKLEFLTINHEVDETVPLSGPAVVGAAVSGIQIASCNFVVRMDSLVLYDIQNYSITDNTFQNSEGSSISIVSTAADRPVKSGIISRNSSTTQNGAGIQIVALTAEGLVEDLIIEDNLIAGAGGSIGIFIPSQGTVIIRNNTMVKTPTTQSGFYGIMLYGTSGVVVENNKATGLIVELAYRFEACSSLTVAGNTADSNYDTGIGLIGVTDSVFTGNVMTGNPNNFWFAPFVMDPGLFPGNEIDTSNLVDGKPVWYLEGLDDLSVNGSEGIGTLILYGCNNATIRNLTGRANGSGITAIRCENLTIANCGFQGMYNGIFVTESPNLTVTDNLFTGCFEGIKVGNFEGGLVAGNTVLHSVDGGILTGGYLFEVTIRDNFIDGAVGGIYLDHDVGRNATISGNRIKHASRVGISSGGSLNMSLTGNSLESIAQVGFDLGESRLLTISDNTLEGLSSVAVALTESPLNSVTGNQLNCLGHGFVLRRDIASHGSFGNLIANNLVNSLQPAKFVVGGNLQNADFPKFNKARFTPVSEIPKLVLIKAQPAAPPAVGDSADPDPPLNVWNTAKTVGLNIVNGPYLGGNYWASPLGTGFSQTTPDRGDGFCNQPLVLSDNNQNTDNLPLHIASPAGVLQDLITTVDQYGLPAGLENSLLQKLTAASKQLAVGKDVATGQVLNAFINEVNAQRGKGLTAARADDLVQIAQWIIQALPGKS